MGLLKIFRLFRKCSGEARWSKYKTFKDKVEVFRILLKLNYYVEIRKKEGEASLQMFGYKVVSPSYFELLYLFREIFLDQQYLLTSKEKAPVIVDCGANIGLATLFFKKMNPMCSIICFEPNPRAYSFLKRNVESNFLQNVNLVNAGLADVIDEIYFYIDKNNTLISSIKEERGAKDKIKIPTVVLSDYIRGKNISLAKVDVEGAEWLILNDVIKTGTINNIKEFIFEYHHNVPGSTHHLGEFLTLLEQHNYKYKLSARDIENEDFQDLLIKASCKP